jgi:hypothetical protein
MRLAELIRIGKRVRLVFQRDDGFAVAAERGNFLQVSVCLR